MGNFSLKQRAIRILQFKENQSASVSEVANFNIIIAEMAFLREWLAISRLVKSPCL